MTKSFPYMKTNALICLGANNNQVPLIKSAKDAGIKVIVIDQNSEAIGFSLADEKIIQSTYDTDKVLESLHTLEKKYSFKGLLARCSGPALNTAATITEKYNLPGPTTKIVQLGTEKSILRDFCKANSLNMPEGEKVIKVEDLSLNLEFPLIIKPDLPIVGKKDIKIVYNKAEIEPAIKKAAQSSDNGFVEVEKYIEGFDVSCLFHLNKGQSNIIACWNELVGVNNDGSIKGNGVSVPAKTVGTITQNLISNVIQRFSSLFSEVNALLIFSFRVDSSGTPYIIELHADLGGDLIADMLLPTANKDFNYFKLVVDFATEKTIEKTNWTFQPTELAYTNDGYKLNQTKSILFLGGGELGTQTIEWAKQIGFTTIVNDKKAEAPGKQIADVKLNFDSTDAESLIQWLKQNNANYNVKYCYCGSDFGLITANKVHKFLGINTSPLEAIKNSLEKSKMKQCWQNSEVHYPESKTVTNIEEAELAISQLGLPVVIKPSKASGSQGVKFIKTEEELLTDFPETKKYCQTDEIIIEQFIDGSHHDVNGLLWQGKFYPCGIGDRFFTKLPYFIPLHGNFPSTLNNEIQNKLYNQLEVGAKALGLTFGPIKADCVIKNNEIYVYEISSRFHGDIFSVRTMGFLKENNPVYQFLQSLYNNQSLFQPIVSNNKVGGWKTVLTNFDNINKNKIEGIFQKNKTLKDQSTVKNNDQIVGLVWASADNFNELNNILNI